MSRSSEQLFSDVAGNPILEIEGNDPLIFKAGYFTSGLGLNLINNLTVVWTTGNPIWKNTLGTNNGPYYAKSTNTFYFRNNLFSHLEYHSLTNKVAFHEKNCELQTMSFLSAYSRLTVIPLKLATTF